MAATVKEATQQVARITHLVRDGDDTLVIDGDSGEVLEQTGDDDTDDLERQRYAAIARIPEHDMFPEGNISYLPAPELEEIAGDVIERYDMDAQHFAVTVLWKRKGGMSRGRPVWGTCEVLRDKTKYFAGETDIVITLSANHCTNARITNYMLESVIHHQLLHIEAMIDEKSGLATPSIRDHDMDGFMDDLKRYGNWLPEYRRMRDAFTQARLIPDEYLT